MPVEVLRFAAPGTPDGDEHPHFVLATRASSFRTSGQGAGICLTWTVSKGDARGVQLAILRKEEVKKTTRGVFSNLLVTRLVRSALPDRF